MTYTIYNFEIMIYGIHLPIYQVQTCISFSSCNTEQFYVGLQMKSHQSLEFLASSSLYLSSSNQHNHILHQPTSLFPLNFNSNILLSINQAYDNNVASVV
jgi:hypothetical protein